MTTALSSLDRRLLTEAEVAALFAVTPRTVRRWASAGELTAIRIGGVTRYRQDEILSVIEPLNEEGRPAGNGTALPSFHPASRRRAQRVETTEPADTMAGDARITLRLPRAVVARLDALAAERGCSRARAFELLLEGSTPRVAAPTPERALQLLADSAEAGSVTARVALARLLSRVPQPDAVQRRRDELAARRLAREAS